MKVIALIPARSGSKRVPNKNIRWLKGKPLMVWTIEVAKACEGVDEVWVSTDSETYARMAKEFGAKVHMRVYAEASNDTAGDFEVIHDFI